MLKKVLKIAGVFALVTVGLFVSYDLGYSRCMDKTIGASECKPSVLWRPRW